jgi:hypothetical protein
MNITEIIKQRDMERKVKPYFDGQWMLPVFEFSADNAWVFTDNGRRIEDARMYKPPPCLRLPRGTV